MEKKIYHDQKGDYILEYDKNGNLIKLYCDEEGNPLEGDERNILDIFKQRDGTYYYEAYNELGEVYKVPCDEDGNEIKTSSIEETPYVAPIPNEQTHYEQQAVGAGLYQDQEPLQQKKSGSKGVIIAALLGIPLLFGGGYYAYSEFLAKPVIKMDGYVVDVKFTGKEGEGKANAKVTAIPDVKISDTSKQKEVDDLLSNAEITYSKESGLSNGDKVSVNIDVDKTEAEALGVEVEGSFRKTVTVGGLTSSSSSSSSDTSKESSKDKETTKETETTSDEAKKDDTKKDETKKLEYKQVYNTGARGLLMRTGPSRSYPSITTLFDGTPVQILEYDGSWAKVNYNGTQGWMHTDYLR